MSTFVFSKELYTDSVVQAELGSLLEPGEDAVSVSPMDVHPESPTPLVTDVKLEGNIVEVMLQGGDEGMSYGQSMEVITSTGRSLEVMIAVSVASQQSQFNPYFTGEPDAFKDLVGTIQRGESAVGSAVFSFPGDVDPSGGYVLWEILGDDGVCYATGNCYSYEVQADGFANTVFAKAVVTVPSNMEETVEQQAYQLRWTLVHGDTKQYSFESLHILGADTVPLGVMPQVELHGDMATMELVTDKLYDRVSIQLYAGNQELGQPAMIYDGSNPVGNRPQRVGSGFFYGAVVDTKELVPSIKPYGVVWKYWDSVYTGSVNSDRADLWIVNPAIMSAVNDVLEKVNKARTTLYGKADLIYPYHTVLTWLRRAADAFNGYQGHRTRFTFLNPTGGVREYWLMFAELFAIESQYLAEGEKAFDYQGAQVSLSLDRTQYLAAAADRIRSVLDADMKPFKYNLIVRGQTGGDGDVEGSTATGAMGAVGITITPAMSLGWYRPRRMNLF